MRTALIVADHITLINNLFARYRSAHQNEISEQAIEHLRDLAKRGQELILVLQGLIDAELPRFGDHARYDAKAKETGEKLREIMHRPPGTPGSSAAPPS